MKDLIRWKLFVLFLLLTFWLGSVNNSFCQDSAVANRAYTYLRSGLEALNRRNYPMSVQYLKISIETLPSALGYYLLATAYERNNNPRNTESNVNLALTARPRLEARYTADAIKLRDWARSRNTARPVSNETENQEGVSTDAVTMGAPKTTLPSTINNPFSTNTKMSGQFLGRYFFPGAGVRNLNETIGDFCCTGETATVENKEKQPVGYIYFYGFSPSTFEILVSGANNNSAERIKDKISFSVSELYSRSKKDKTVGILKYTVTILEVEKTANSYFSQSVKVQVDVSMSPF